MKVIDHTEPKRGKGSRRDRTPSPAKQRRIDAQRVREEANRRLRANGEPTPWERAKADRRERRERLRAAGKLVQQKRINGKIVKIDPETGASTLVECCPECTRRGFVEVRELPDADRRDRASAAAKKVSKSKSKPKAKPTRKAPRQITPKEQ